MKKDRFYRNSDLRINKYFAQVQFKSRLERAKRHGKEVFYNEVRILNNCYYARKLQGDISIKDIFQIYWKDFKKKYYAQLKRPNLIDSIETMISCHNFNNGYLYYECPNCKNFYMIGFSCKSRFCQSCGQKYKKARTEKISEKCLKMPHRQFVFTIPCDLRIYFRKDHRLLDLLFKSASEALVSCLKKSAPIAYVKEHRQLGYIMFLHTFGRDLKWHPHLHILLAERYISNDGSIHKFNYFHFDYLRKTFQNKLFHNIYLFYKTIIRNNFLTNKMLKLLNYLKNKYPDGYYVYGPKFDDSNTTTSDMKKLTSYICRYASHPPISERRILSINKNSNQISWFYDPHEDDDIKDEEQKIGRQFITEHVFEFMKKLIIHIPDKGFQIIRYYGFYSNKFKFKHLFSNNKLFSNASLKKMLDNIKWINGLLDSFGYNPLLCSCGSHMYLNPEFCFYPRGPNNEI